MGPTGSASLLFGDTLDAAATAVYTANDQIEITLISLVADAAATVKLYHVPEGETQADKHEFYRNVMKADETAGLTFKAEGSGPTLAKGDRVFASHNAADDQVIMTMYGIVPELG